EVVVPELEADGPARIALAREVGGDARAQFGEDAGQLVTVAGDGEVAFERELAADRLRLGIGDHRAIIVAVRSLVQPCTVVLPEALDQELRIRRGELADRANAERGELRAGLGSDPI